ncbi:MAG: hypothetical protein ABI577_01665 [bacterium]
MKVKTSITMSSDLLCRLDEEVGPEGSRSALIEALVRRHLNETERARNFDREVALLNAIVDGDDPPDVLDYTIDPDTLGDEFEFAG